MNQPISIVIPVFNEEASLSELYTLIKKVLKQEKNNQYEIIFVNDGSTDKTLSIVRKLHLKDKRVKVLSFRKNLGKAAALQEGFKKSTGQIIITLDGDLQDGPENIPALLSKLNEGYDLVIGWKKKRHDPLAKTLPSKLFNTVVGKVSHLPLHDFNSGLKAMRSEVAQEIRLYGELHRFIPILAHQRGFKVTEISVTHHPRKYGSSKYGWERLLKGFFDFLTITFLGRFSQRPFHLFGFFGSISILIGVLMGIYLSILHFSGQSIGDRPLLNLSVLLVLAGLQLLSIGLIAEMIVSRPQSNYKLPINYETK